MSRPPVELGLPTVRPEVAPGFAREEGWEVLRFERLGRRMKVAAAAVAMGAAGALGREVATRRR